MLELRGLFGLVVVCMHVLRQRCQRIHFTMLVTQDSSIHQENPGGLLASKPANNLGIARR
jgi:hypothetical protein